LYCAVFDIRSIRKGHGVDDVENELRNIISEVLRTFPIKKFCILG
jgi:hypothetical protein